MEFPPKEYKFTLLLTRKEKLPKCQEISLSLLGVKTLLFLLLVDGQEEMVSVLVPRFFHSKMADFVLLATLSSATFTDTYSVTPRLHLVVQQTKMLTERC